MVRLSCGASPISGAAEGGPAPAKAAAAFPMFGTAATGAPRHRDRTTTHQLGASATWWPETIPKTLDATPKSVGAGWDARRSSNAISFLMLRDIGGPDLAQGGSGGVKVGTDAPVREIGAWHQFTRL